MKIANCPFCSGSSGLTRYSDIGEDGEAYNNFIFCGECKCQGPSSMCRDEALASWNKRADVTLNKDNVKCESTREDTLEEKKYLYKDPKVLIEALERTYEISNNIVNKFSSDDFTVDEYTLYIEHLQISKKVKQALARFKEQK